MRNAILDVTYGVALDTQSTKRRILKLAGTLDIRRITLMRGGHVGVRITRPMASAFVSASRSTASSPQQATGPW